MDKKAKLNKVSRAILYNKEGKVLLGRRVKNYGVGKYALIGGLPENNETPEQTIIREVKEELGITFKPELFKEAVDKIAEEKVPWLVTFFFGKIEGEPDINPNEVSDIIFVSQDDLDEYDIAFNHRDILKEFFFKKRVF